MAKSNQKNVPKTALIGRLGTEAALAVNRHNGAGIMRTDKRDTMRAVAKRNAIGESY